MSLIQAMTSVNWLAILISGIVFMVLGFVWYSVIFGKQYGVYTGMTAEKMKEQPPNQMIVPYVITFVCALLQVWALAGLLKEIGVLAVTDTTPIKTALGVALIIWVGFVGAPTLAGYVFERRPLGLWAINTGLYLVNLLVAAIILVVIR